MEEERSIILLFDETDGSERIFYTKKYFELYKLGLDLYDTKKRDLINKLYNINFDAKYKKVDIINKLECFFYIFSNIELKEYLTSSFSNMRSQDDLDKLLDLFVAFIRGFDKFKYANFLTNIMLIEFKNIFLNDKLNYINYNNEELMMKSDLVSNCKVILEGIEKLYLHITNFLEEYTQNRRISLNDYINFLSLPKTEKILYIKENGKKIKLGKKFLIKEINNLNLSKINENFSLDTIINEEYLYKNNYIEIDNIYYENYYKIECFNDYLMACINYILEKKIIINKCRNCGKLFIPINKNNEELCGYIYKNNKTCKELSYEIKLENDEITKIYRKNYKTQNAKKNRNLHIIDINLKFNKWVNEAQKYKKKCENGNITIEEYIKWFDDNNNWVSWKNYK